ncbi:hypothetical protein GW17_00001143 [Ensete ventricosum]|nr:hypothetical protein GW17_00001143 [Ensete ventricosum]RZS27051.1 hypothetical protein BHM03_00060479 [Ensete ventricosum]
MREVLRMIREVQAEVMVSSNSSDHSSGRWSNMVQNLPREDGLEDDDRSASTLTSTQKQRGSGLPPPTPATSSSTIDIVCHQILRLLFYFLFSYIFIDKINIVRINEYDYFIFIIIEMMIYFLKYETETLNTTNYTRAICN